MANDKSASPGKLAIFIEESSTIRGLVVRAPGAKTMSPGSTIYVFTSCN